MNELDLTQMRIDIDEEIERATSAEYDLSNKLKSAQTAFTRDALIGFAKRNVYQNGCFHHDTLFPGIPVTDADMPEISSESYSGGYSLNINAINLNRAKNMRLAGYETTDVINGGINCKKVYVAFMANISNYVAGNIGVRIGSTTVLQKANNTDGWEMVSGIYEFDTATNRILYVGGFDNCNFDAKMDNIFIMPIYSGEEYEKAELDLAYKCIITDNLWYDIEDCLTAYTRATTKKCAESGMSNSSFVSPSGQVMRYSDESRNKSTCEDILRLGIKAMSNELAMFGFSFRGTGDTNVKLLNSWTGGSSFTYWSSRAKNRVCNKGGSHSSSIDNETIVTILSVFEDKGDLYVANVAYKSTYGDAPADSVIIDDLTAVFNLAKSTIASGGSYPVPLPEGTTCNIGGCALISRVPSAQVYPVSEGTDNLNPIVSSNINEEFMPASIAKVMTAIIAGEMGYALDDIIHVSVEDVHTVGNISNTSTGNGGYYLTVKDALIFMFMASNNRIATSLGRNIGLDLLYKGL